VRINNSIGDVKNEEGELCCDSWHEVQISGREQLNSFFSYRKNVIFKAFACTNDRNVININIWAEEIPQKSFRRADFMSENRMPYHELESVW
jgi:hypothetical protein